MFVFWHEVHSRLAEFVITLAVIFYLPFYIMIIMIYRSAELTIQDGKYSVHYNANTQNVFKTMDKIIITRYTIFFVFDKI